MKARTFCNETEQHITQRSVTGDFLHGRYMSGARTYDHSFQVTRFQCNCSSINIMTSEDGKCCVATNSVSCNFNASIYENLFSMKIQLNLRLKCVLTERKLYISAAVHPGCFIQ